MITPEDRDFFQGMIIDGAITSLPTQKNRLLSMSGVCSKFAHQTNLEQDRKISKEMLAELEVIVPISEQLFPSAYASISFAG